jgi:rhodanese-related sulfurtransferase
MSLRLLAIVALSAGVLAAFAGSPYSSRPVEDSTETRALMQQLATSVSREEDHVTALELAAWIRDRKPGLRVIDLRSQKEFDEFHLPGAQRIALEAIAATPFGQDETIVLLSEGGAHAAQAWVFLRALGHRQAYFLRGGVGEWIAQVQNPARPTPLTRYFGRRGC